MCGGETVGEEIAEPSLRPAVDEHRGDEVQIGARVDLVRDTGPDDREDLGGSFPAEVLSGEEPIAPAEYEFSQLTFDVVVGQFDVAVAEKQCEAFPLSAEVPERCSERGSGRRRRLLFACHALAYGASRLSWVGYAAGARLILSGSRR